MEKKGIISLTLLSAVSPRLKQATVPLKLKCSEYELTAQVPVVQNEKILHYYLPLSDKIILQMLGNNQAIGYFQLPLKKIYQHPFKKHLITVKCVTKDHQNTIKPDQFGTVKLCIVFMQHQTAKFDVLIKNIQITEEKENAIQKQLYVECTVGNVTSQTTLKKKKDNLYQWNEVLPFTLQAIPGRIEIIVKDKDMVNNEIIGKTEIDPQKELMFEEAKIEKQFHIPAKEQKMAVNLTTTFKLLQHKG